MKTIKDAADALLSKGSISKEEYSMLKEAGAFNPQVGFLKSLYPKRGIAETLKDFGKSLISNTGAAIENNPLKSVAIGSALGLAGKELVFDPISESMKINKSFEDMQIKIPQLAGKNQEDIKDYFNVVKTFSPKAASNPLVAGALVNKMMEFGGVDHKLVQDISAIQLGLARPSVVETATQAAAKAFTGKATDSV